MHKDLLMVLEGILKEAVLREFWRVLSIGGILGLYKATIQQLLQ